MTKVCLLAIVGVLAASQIGCGSGNDSGGGGGGSAPDFDALEGRLTAPSGTFAAGQEGSVQDAFGSQSTAAQGNPFGSSSGSNSTKSVGGLSIQNLHPLDNSNACASLKDGGKG